MLRSDTVYCGLSFTSEKHLGATIRAQILHCYVPPAGVLSQTLQSITTTKIRELEKQRRWFESRKAKILQDVQSVDSQQDRVRVLLLGLEGLARPGVGLDKLWRTDSNEYILKNVRRYLDQSDYDPSV